MRGNYAITERQYRIRKILATLKDANNKGVQISFNKFKAELGLKFGLSMRKIDEYIAQLEDSEAIEIKENEFGEKIIEFADKK